MNYIVAVSGGVDSVVLLDMLVQGELRLESENGRATQQSPQSSILNPQSRLIVAHFDHGIRQESAKDAEFVKQLAEHYGLEFEKGSANLGKNASEEKARDERYKFLQSCRKKYNTQAIVLAHHQDDVIETAIINLIRGTGWRGLASIDSTGHLIRPLLGYTKQDLLDYARKHNLDWVEDSTNSDQTYLRNYVRHTIIPGLQAKNTAFKQQFVEHIENVKSLKPELDKEVLAIVSRLQTLPTEYIVPRYKAVAWPTEVALAIVHSILTSLDSQWHPTQIQITKALHFIKTGLPGKTLAISKHLKLTAKNRHVEFKKY